MRSRFGWTDLFLLLCAVAFLAIAFVPARGETLLWTAPGDDGSTGRAALYEARYRTSAIVGTDSLSWWNAATRISGLPVPGTAGTTDSVRVSGLDPYTSYWFMVRAADEASNWSGFSNVPTRPAAARPDSTPPAPIRALRIVP